MNREHTVWDHWPTDAELALVLVNPITGEDQWGSHYEPMVWPTGRRIPAVCTACDKDFVEGGFWTLAPQGKAHYRVLLCGEHVAPVVLAAEEEEIELGVAG